MIHTTAAAADKAELLEARAVLHDHMAKSVSLKASEWERIAAAFVSERFKKRCFIIQEEDRVDYLYFIVSGVVKLCLTDRDAKEHIISFAMEDWWETDYQAFHTRGKATQSLQCITDCETLKISFSDYQNLLTEIPSLAVFFLHKAVGGHIANQRRVLSLMTMSAAARYDQFLSYYPSLVQRVPKVTLAAYLGVSRETLSRLWVRSPSK